MPSFRAWLDARVAHFLLLCAEFWKAFVHEVWALVAKLVTLYGVVALFLVRNMGPYWRQRNRIVPDASLSRFGNSASSSALLTLADREESSEELVGSGRGSGARRGEERSAALETPHKRRRTPFVDLLRSEVAEDAGQGGAEALAAEGERQAGADGRGRGATLRQRRTALRGNRRLDSTAEVVSDDPDETDVDKELTTAATRGLLQDFRLQILLAIDRFFLTVTEGASWLIRTPVLSVLSTLLFTAPLAVVLLFVRAAFRSAAFVVGKLRRSSPLVQSIVEEVDPPAPSQYENTAALTALVEGAGYQFKRYQVTTADGYVNTLDRIPNPGAKRVAYLQHGVLDSSIAWVSTGTRSLAYSLCDKGYDVWLGNLRGTSYGGKRHADEYISQKEYWDFSVNDHAMYDIPAFMRFIGKQKRDEGVPDYSIQIVAHSLGACATLMYLVYRAYEVNTVHKYEVTGQAVQQVASDGSDDEEGDGAPANASDPNNNDNNADDSTLSPLQSHEPISGCVLLSPAGIHSEHPKIIYLLIPLIEILLWVVPVYYFKLPGVSFINRLWQDVRQTPTTRYLLGFFLSMLLGGEADSHAAVHHVKDLPQHLSGTSVGVYRHFVQMWRAKKFQGFDYGAARNRLVYGREKPLDMLKNYDLIDVPVHFVMGTEDFLIAPSNIVKHYAALSAFHPTLAHLHAFPKSGHLEFTIGMKEWHVDQILLLLEGNLSEEETGVGGPQYELESASM